MKKRALRRHHRDRVGRNRRKLALSKGYEHIAESSLNALAERHPFNCGRRCLMCHGEKILGNGQRRQRWRRQWKSDL